MRILFTFYTLLLLTSCFNTNGDVSEKNQQNLRITRLEQRIDSLINGRSTEPVILDYRNSGSNPVPYGTVKQFDRCQAITKKGAQCKRRASNGVYCWQHGA